MLYDGTSLYYTSSLASADGIVVLSHVCKHTCPIRDKFSKFKVLASYDQARSKHKERRRGS